MLKAIEDALRVDFLGARTWEVKNLDRYIEADMYISGYVATLGLRG